MSGRSLSMKTQHTGVSERTEGHLCSTYFSHTGVFNTSGVFKYICFNTFSKSPLHPQVFYVASSYLSDLTLYVSS